MFWGFLFCVLNVYPSAEEKGAFRGLHSRSLPDISALDRGTQMFNLGIDYVKKGDNKNAKKWFLEAARCNETRAMNYLGMYSLREGNENEAQTWFDKGIKLGDVISKYNLASLYHQRGDAAQETGKIEESQKYIGKAIRLYSEIVASYPGAKNNLAVILYEQGEEDQALKLWQEAKTEGYLSAIFNVAWVADKRGDNETAKTGYEQVAKEGDLDAMFYLAKIHEKEKDLESAKLWYKKAAEKGDSEAMIKVKEMGSGTIKRKCKRKLSLLSQHQ